MLTLLKNARKSWTTKREHQTFIQNFKKSTSLVPDHRSGRKVDQKLSFELVVTPVRKNLSIWVVSISAFLVFFHAYSHTGVYFLENIQHLNPPLYFLLFALYLFKDLTLFSFHILCRNSKFYPKKVIHK